MTDTRIEMAGAYPAGYQAMFEFHKADAASGLDPILHELIKIRASQVNGCAFCLDMHTKDARAAGETEQRIYGLSAWRDTPFYTPAERAALALTEAVTLITDGHVPDDVFDEAKHHFDEETLGKIIMAIVVINAWNRLGITQRLPVGDYQPGGH